MAELLLMYLVIGTALVSFVVGFALGDFQLMVKINGVGLVVTLLAVLPDWPFYNKHPVEWAPPLFPKEEAAGASSKNK